MLLSICMLFSRVRHRAKYRQLANIPPHPPPPIQQSSDFLFSFFHIITLVKVQVQKPTLQYCNCFIISLNMLIRVIIQYYIHVVRTLDAFYCTLLIPQMTQGIIFTHMKILQFILYMMYYHIMYLIFISRCSRPSAWCVPRTPTTAASSFPPPTSSRCRVAYPPKIQPHNSKGTNFYENGRIIFWG